MPEQYQTGTFKQIFSNWGEKHAPVLLPTDKLIAPIPGVFDEPTRCYTINKEWAPIVMGTVSLLTDIKMWAGAEDENFSAIQSVLQFLEGAACGMINCAEVLACINADAGYRFVVESIVNQSGQSFSEWYDATDAAYSTALQDIWPEIPVTAPSADAIDDITLCAAIERWLSVWSINKRVSIQSDTGGVLDIWQALADLGLKAWHLATSAANWLMNEFLGEHPTAEADAALIDQSALDDVACCLWNSLRGAPVTEAAFDAALASCAASLSGNAAIVAELLLISQSLPLVNLFTFGDAWNYTIEALESNQSLGCACSGEWLHSFDFRYPQSMWTVETGGGSYQNSTWVSGLGFVAALELDGARRVGVESTIALTPTYGISYTLDVIGTIGGFNHNTSAYIDGVFAGAPAQQTFNVLSDTANQQFSLPLSPAKNSDYFRLRASVIPSTGFERLVITKATVRGTGSDPFL